ncbi:MAG: hypothetical protein J6T10_21080 [Methanobrevibacter sp.]|nr:hypothetical protein [Methanobrevibacter sp.]
MIWYDTTNDALKNHNGTGWIIMATKPYVDSKVSDTAYDNNWDGETDTAPSKNAVYDKINSIDELIPNEATSSNQLADKNYVNNKISDTTYGNSWDGETDTAPSKNAVYDKINSID